MIIEGECVVKGLGILLHLLPMKRVVVVSIILIFVAGLVFGGIGFFLSRRGGILVESVPTAMVSINGEQVGRTPYEASYPSGEVVVKLVPEGSEPMEPYEAYVKVVAGVKTVVRRDFGETEGRSGGEEIFFERRADRVAGITVVSIPQAARVMIDGNYIGTATLSVDNLEAGQHTVRADLDGYEPREFVVRSVSGYTLTVVTKLALNPHEEIVFEEPEEKISITIEDTPVGYLRVRSEADVRSEEVGRVEPGEQYLLLEESEDGDWYRIDLGWISSEFASKSAD